MKQHTFHLVADSCCDTSPEMEARLGGIHKAPLTVQVDDRAYLDDGSLSAADMLSAIKAGRKTVRSACPSPEQYAALLRDRGDSLVVTLSGKLSGSFNAAATARSLLLEEDPGRHIVIVDSASASAGETRLLLYAQECREAGLSLDETAKKTEAFARGMRTLFVLEDLSNLVKNGRLQKVSGVVASILSLCPILGDDGSGDIRLIAKARGVRNALHRLLDVINSETAGLAPGSLLLVMAHCNAVERARTLQYEIQKTCRAVREVVVVPTGGLSTMYAGDGGIVVAF